MKTSIIPLRLALFAAAFVIQHSSFVIAQGGSLTPPGAPAVLFKTLNEVEPRTPISSAPFTISTSGSYYLTGNLTVTTGNAISITTDDVTLDLSGFTISSTASPANGAGVLLSGLRKNVTVKNGRIRGTTTFSGTFTTGGFLDGIDANTSNTANLRFADIEVLGVGDAGINTIITGSSVQNVIERCHVSICAGTGLRAGTITDSHVDTAGSTGIAGVLVSNCFGQSTSATPGNHGVTGFATMENCRGTADAGNGIQGTGGQVSNCTGNSVSGTGLTADCASNCKGISASGNGISAIVVLNSMGESTSGTNGITASVVSFCRGRRDGGVAITCFNAIGCFVVGTGTVTATNKSLGTP